MIGQQNPGLFQTLRQKIRQNKKRKQNLKKVSFATTCWERDWKIILKDSDYLSQKMIGNHNFDFFEKILVVNNVEDPEEVLFWARQKVRQKILTHVYLASDYDSKALDFFSLKRTDFKALSPGVKDAWVYYNARGLLTALYKCRGDFFLYHTGDAYLAKKTDWIDKALVLMEKYPDCKVANLTWNNCFQDAEKEACKKEKGFFISGSGFSDQQFLVKTADFKQPIFSQIREDSRHFPWGNTLEKRVFSFMKNHKWKRITYSRGSYLHKSF